MHRNQGTIAVSRGPFTQPAISVRRNFIGVFGHLQPIAGCLVSKMQVTVAISIIV